MSCLAPYLGAVLGWQEEGGTRSRLGRLGRAPPTRPVHPQPAPGEPFELGRLSGALQPSPSAEPLSRPPFTGVDYKTTTILLDGRRVKLQLW